MLCDHESAVASPSPTINDEILQMFIRLLFSHMVAETLVEDQAIDCPKTLASLSDNDIIAICEEIRGPGGLIGRRISDRGNQISVLVMISLKLAMFMFKMMECCSKPYNIYCVCNRSVLQYHHQ